MRPRDAPARRSTRRARRPDFVALLYPVITMRDPFAHRDSRTNLLGANPPESLVARMSLETQVTPKTAAGVPRPHRRGHERAAREQPDVLPGAATRGRVRRAHLYERGAHGFGMTRARPDVRVVRDAGSRMMARRLDRRDEGVSRPSLAAACSGWAQGRASGQPAGAWASRGSGRPTSATAPTSIRSSPATIRIRRS